MPAHPCLCQCPYHTMLLSSPHSSVFTRPQAQRAEAVSYCLCIQHSSEWSQTAHCRTSLDICWMNEIFSPADLYLLDPFFLCRMQSWNSLSNSCTTQETHLLCLLLAMIKFQPPKLKEVKLSSEEMKDAYYQTLHVLCHTEHSDTDLLKYFL